MKRILVAAIILFSLANCFGTSYQFTTLSATFSEGAGTVVAGYVKATGVLVAPESVDIVLQSGSGDLTDINNYITQTLTFSPGGIDSLALNITITDDVLIEGIESIVFALRNPSDTGTIGVDSLLTIDITDNDLAPNPSVEFVVTSSSQNEGVGSFQIALSLVNSNSNPTSVDINVSGGGTAAFGSDFIFSPLTVTFPGGSPITQFATVTFTDDIIAEGNESFTFQLASPTNNATIGTNGQHTVTIIDNDTLRFSINPSSQIVNENAGVITFPVELNNISTNSTSVTVHLETAGTTATQGSDFNFSDTILVWPAGSTGPILVPVYLIDDTLFEPNETVKLKLINATNGAGFLNDNLQLDIQNNDPVPSGPCANLFFSEFIEGTADNRGVEVYNPTALFVNLSDYKIFKSNDGGTGGLDVFALSGVLAPGATWIGVNPAAVPLLTSISNATSVFFDCSGNDALALLHFTDTIDIIGQLWSNPGISWTLTGGSTQDHTIVRSYYNYSGETDWSIAADTWNVYPNDMFDSLGFHHTAPCGTPKPIIPSYIHFTVLSDTISESDGTVKVVVQVDNPNSTSVRFLVTRDDSASTASPGTDYTFSNRNIIRNTGGTTFDTVSITVLEDQLIEPTETIVLHFINLGIGVNPVPDSTFTLYVKDNDTLSVSFFGAGFGYVEKDTTVGVKVFLSTFPDTLVKVTVSNAPGNALAGTDYIFSNTVLIFPAGSTDTQTAWVTLIDDNLPEANEQINFDIAIDNGIRIQISAYTLTIIDNDEDVGISQIDLENSITIFPNPVIQKLTIQTESELQNVTLSDLVGKVVMSLGKLPPGKNPIDVSHLSNGMYFVNMHDEQKNLSKRFIKSE